MQTQKGLMFLILLLSAPVMADPGESCEPLSRRGPPPPPHEIIAEHAEELGLDEETLAQIQGLSEERIPELKAMQEELRAASSDQEALAEELHEASKALMDDIMALMTDEQRAILKEIMPPPPPRGLPPGHPPGD